MVTKHTTPLSILIYVVNKKSQNHYAEQVLKMIGAEKRNQGTVSCMRAHCSSVGRSASVLVAFGMGL